MTSNSTVEVMTAKSGVLQQCYIKMGLLIYSIGCNTCFRKPTDSQSPLEILLYHVSALSTPYGHVCLPDQRDPDRETCSESESRPSDKGQCPILSNRSHSPGSSGRYPEVETAIPSEWLKSPRARAPLSFSECSSSCCAHPSAQMALSAASSALL